MNQMELKKVEAYLHKTFGSPVISVKKREKKTDSAEVFVKDEFVGVIYKDDEDGELTYQFQMAILASDLED